MNEYKSALLAAEEGDYESASKSLHSALETTYKTYSELLTIGKASAPIHERIDSTGPVLLLASLHTLNGSILYRQQHWGASLKEYLTAQKLLQRTLNATTRLQIAFLANCIGKCHLQLQSYTEGIHCLEKGVQQALSINMIYSASTEEEQKSVTRDASIILVGLHTTLSCCYIQLQKPVEALIHATFVQKRLEACSPETDDYARASVLLAECMVCANNGNRATFVRALGILNKAAKVYRQLLKASRVEGGELSLEQRERILWLLNTYYLISRVLLFTNCKRDAELYAYKAEKLVMTMRLQPSDVLYIKVHDLIYWCRHGVPRTSSMRKDSLALDNTIENDLRSLLDTDARERFENDTNLANMIKDAIEIIRRNGHSMSKHRYTRRPVSAPLLANPEKFNITPARLIAKMDRKKRVSEGAEYDIEVEKRSHSGEDSNNSDEITRLIRCYKTTDIKPYAPLK